MQMNTIFKDIIKLIIYVNHSFKRIFISFLTIRNYFHKPQHSYRKNNCIIFISLFFMLLAHLTTIFLSIFLESNYLWFYSSYIGSKQ